MSKASHYWTIARLNAAGQIKLAVMANASAFFKQHFPDTVEQDEVADASIQAQLLTLWDAIDASTAATAELCLRCYISHQIVQVCTSLQAQFGKHYGLTLQDLLPYVLNDEGRVPADPQCLTMQILQSFQPGLSVLPTWTARRVRQHHGLNQVLMEHGLYLVSDWAILNDTKLEQLSVILINFYGFSAAEVNQNCVLLESYRSVYLPDRLKQRGKCADPTLEQLKRISSFMQTKTAELIASDVLLAQLQSLAKCLRQYRIAKRGGPLPAESIDTPEGTATIEQLEATATDDSDDRQQLEFLRLYRQLFVDCLGRALEQVVTDRQQKSKKAEQALQFTTALHLFYCQQLSMTAIAQQLGLRGQDAVTRLLKLKDFRADVRRHMLKHLQSHVLEEAQAYCDPDRLQQLDDRVEAALNEQLETLMEEEAKRAQTAKTCLSVSLFSQKLCQTLK